MITTLHAPDLHAPDPLTGGPYDTVSAYSQEVLASLPRSDQRRWGEVYLRGLLHTRGRKTPGTMTQEVLGRRSVQSIQQFINQSTWPPEEIRRCLAERLSGVAAPQAWAFDDVVFPKNGTRSVGVARQFVPADGRVVNCQIGLAASLVHPAGTLPVNWRLLLPRRWEADPELREKAHVPAGEHHRPRWQHLLESIDEMLAGWNVPVAPVLADCRSDREVEPLIAGLEQRRLSYLLQIGADTPLPGRPLAVRSTTPVRAGARDIARCLPPQAERAVLPWRSEPAGRSRPSQFAAVPLASPVPPGPGPRPAGLPRRYLVVEWPFGHEEPRNYWVTNLPVRRLPDIVALAELRHRSLEACRLLHQDYGLGDFEGRSFRGWHHHVTLVSAACGYHVLRDLGADGAAIPLDGTG